MRSESTSMSLHHGSLSMQKRYSRSPSSLCMCTAGLLCCTAKCAARPSVIMPGHKEKNQNTTML